MNILVKYIIRRNNNDNENNNKNKILNNNKENEEMKNNIENVKGGRRMISKYEEYEILKEYNMIRTRKKDKLRIRFTSTKSEYETYKQFNFGNYDYNNLKDLQWIPTTYIEKEIEDEDGQIKIELRKVKLRKMNRSEIIYTNLYGEEWGQIINNIRIEKEFICQRCKLKFDNYNLHTHHIKPISQFIKEGKGIIENEYHLCYGIKTNKPWHTEDNLILLCQNCHAEEHPHMRKMNIEPMEESQNKFKINKDRFEQQGFNKIEKDEMKLQIRKMFQD